MSVEASSREAKIQALENLDEAIAGTTVGEKAVGKTVRCAEEGDLYLWGMVTQQMTDEGRVYKGRISYTPVCTKGCSGCQAMKKS